MLEVQKYLLSPGKSLETLNKEYGINSCIHPLKDKYPIVILNYDQINSIKSEKIVRECRCLILELESYELVSKSFYRFFNVGEMLDEFTLFDWNSVIVQEKCDGSIISLFYYKDKWHITTRGSWAEGNINLCNITWKKVILECLGVNSEEELNNLVISKAYTYVFELCSPYNKVVRYYPESKLYLLSIFWGEIELNKDYVDYDLKLLNLNFCSNRKILRPEEYSFKTLEEVQNYIKTKEKEDATYEGVVLRDKNNSRWKLKSSTYLSLSHLKGNDNIWNKRHLIIWILTGEDKELLVYFPEIKSLWEEVKFEIDKEFLLLQHLWWKHKDIVLQKEFAVNIKDSTRFSNLLFQARKEYLKTKIDNIDNRNNSIMLNNLWRDSEDQIYQVLYKGK